MVELITPKPPAPNPVAGIEKYGWLKMLKNSVRNSMPAFSPIMVRLNTAKSKLLIPGPRRLGSTRASFPNPHWNAPLVVGAVKHDVLNHCERWPPPAFLSQPDTTSGRTFATPRPALSNAVDPA